MKINKNTSTPALPSDDTEPTSSTTKTENTKTDPTKSQTHKTDTHLPPPINLVHYAKTGSLHPLKNTLLTAAQKILTSQTKNPAATARDQVIELVLKENFKSALTHKEQREIAQVLKTILADDPVFSGEIDNMLNLAALKLKNDN